ncbi:hypothetical protein GOP47_0021798 [Adiantum capillus-veneris]|uniref:S1 motif domain-containing protein n=1 Tax=Adiantum capillus-veneris TaxID=13818 RepID=A0A9D4Z869_ADICA|nr:hypothetical protein GOP47_0021798 [Adiantum capillus-veneris]
MKMVARDERHNDRRCTRGPVRLQSHIFNSLFKAIGRVDNLETFTFKMLPSSLTCSSLASESMKLTFDASSKKWPPQQTMLHNVQKKGRTFCTMFNNESGSVQYDQGIPQQPRPQQRFPPPQYNQGTSQQPLQQQPGPPQYNQGIQQQPPPPPQYNQGIWQQPPPPPQYNQGIPQQSPPSPQYNQGIPQQPPPPPQYNQGIPQHPPPPPPPQYNQGIPQQPPPPPPPQYNQGIPQQPPPPPQYNQGIRQQQPPPPQYNQGGPQQPLQQQQPPPPPSPPPQPTRTFSDTYSDPYQMTSTVRRRPYNLEAKMRMKQYRREAMMQRRQQELEEEQRTFQLDYTTIYQKGHPGTVQAVIKEIIHLGYIVTLPNGREGLLAASHLGCSGGIPLLERLFSVGQEITVRVIPVPNPAGKDRIYVRP